jgi:hypothetical protein
MPTFTNVPDNRYINRGGQGFTGSLETMERAYDCWKRGRWSDDPFIETVIPSAWDPTVAPPGCHWMSCFVQYCPPTLADGEWTPEKRDAFGATVIDKIERYAPGFRDLVVHAEIRTPFEIENEIGLTEGNIFQGELTIDQLLFNRPFPGYGQYRMPLKNMYMCGSSTHPGGGVSSACGANAAREILRDLKRKATRCPRMTSTMSNPDLLRQDAGDPFAGERLKLSHFHERQAPLNLRDAWSSWNGFKFADYYYDVDYEYFCIRNTCGTYDICPMQKYLIEGPGCLAHAQSHGHPRHQQDARGPRDLLLLVHGFRAPDRRRHDLPPR